MSKLFELLNDSWITLLRDPQRFLIFFVFQCFIQLLSPVGEVMGIQPGSMPGVLLELLVAALTIWNFTYLIHVLMDMEKGTEESSIELFIQATYDTPAFFLYSLMYGLTFALGAILLIIPGLYFLIFHYFAPMISVIDPDADEGDETYFSLSRKLVKPHWGKVIGFFLILLVLNLSIPAINIFPQLKDIRLVLDMGLVPLEVFLILIGDVLAYKFYFFLKSK